MASRSVAVFGFRLACSMPVADLRHFRGKSFSRQIVCIGQIVYYKLLRLRKIAGGSRCSPNCSFAILLPHPFITWALQAALLFIKDPHLGPITAWTRVALGFDFECHSLPMSGVSTAATGPPPAAIGLRSAGGRPCIHRTTAGGQRAKNSDLSAAATSPVPLNAPRKVAVDVTDPGFSTPRMTMHMCAASIVTATPRALQVVSTASAIWLVNCSWI